MPAQSGETSRIPVYKRKRLGPSLPCRAAGGRLPFNSQVPTPRQRCAYAGLTRLQLLQRGLAHSFAHQRCNRRCANAAPTRLQLLQRGLAHSFAHHCRAYTAPTIPTGPIAHSFALQCCIRRFANAAPTTLRQIQRGLSPTVLLTIVASDSAPTLRLRRFDNSNGA